MKKVVLLSPVNEIEATDWLMSHNCQFIIDCDAESEGEPIFCDKPASLRLYENWFCAKHYDIVERNGANILGWKGQPYYSHIIRHGKRIVDEIAKLDKNKLLSIMYSRELEHP